MNDYAHIKEDEKYCSRLASIVLTYEIVHYLEFNWSLV